MASAILPFVLRLFRVREAPVEWLLRQANPNYRGEDPTHLAKRTLTGRRFSELLKTDSIHSLVSHFFIESELAALELEGRVRRG
jgi:hypothetical protein